MFELTQRGRFQLLAKLAACIAIVAIAWVFVSPMVDLPFSTEHGQRVSVLASSTPILMLQHLGPLATGALSSVGPLSGNLALIDLTCSRLC